MLRAIVAQARFGQAANGLTVCVRRGEAAPHTHDICYADLNHTCS
jgi:hypothetical protein